jgi:LysR family transcriptional regulator, carnitine catabolism transcriptional activator
MIGYHPASWPGLGAMHNVAMATPLHVTLRQLRAFEAAYRLRNLTHAADALHMTQSAMSALIKQLEDSLDVQLFERTPRALKPTAAADEAYPQTVDILSRVGILQAGMKDRAKGAETLLSFSCVPSLASTVVPTVLSRFRRAMPTVRPVVFDEGADALMERVRSGECEFSVSTFAQDPEALAQIPLVLGHLGVACAKGSPLAKLKRVTWADLVGQSIIHLSKGSSLRQQIQQYFPDAARNYKPAYEISFIHTALAMAAEGLGVVIVQSFLVEGNPHMKGLVLKKLHDPIAEKSLIIQTRKGHELSRPAQLFLGMLRDHLTAP